jgi:hypothetical protein
VEKCIVGLGGLENLSPGNALRRVFECVASGVLLNGKFCFCTCQNVTVVLSYLHTGTVTEGLWRSLLKLCLVHYVRQNFSLGYSEMCLDQSGMIQSVTLIS